MIENRLTKNSSSSKLFWSIKKEYIDALKLNGYNYDINYMKVNNERIVKREKENAFGLTLHIAVQLKQM